IFISQPLHLVTLRTSQFVRLPLSRAGRENLKRVASQPVGALGGVFRSSCGRSMDTYAPRRELRRPLRRRSFEDVLFLGYGARHDSEVLFPPYRKDRKRMGHLHEMIYPDDVARRVLSACCLLLLVFRLFFRP